MVDLTLFSPIDIIRVDWGNIALGYVESLNCAKIQRVAFAWIGSVRWLIVQQDDKFLTPRFVASMINSETLGKEQNLWTLAICFLF